MHTFFGRFRSKSTSPIEAELRAGRPQPPAQLVDQIVGTLDRRQARRSSASLRLGWASALTVALVAGLAATGGVVYAATALVHVTSAPRAPQAVQAPAVTSACSQYAVKPVITSVMPTAGFYGQRVRIAGGHFAGPSLVTSVRFGTVAASFTVTGPARIDTTVPYGASTAGITVSNCKGSSTSTRFTVYKKYICLVPRLIGMTIFVARQAIAAGHCQVGAIRKIGRNTGTYHVVNQSPKAGTQLVPPGYVSFTVSR